MTDHNQIQQTNNDDEGEIGNDYDSALGSDIGSDTQTLNSLLTRYTWQHGRRYHAGDISNGYYWGPNDESASEQQNMTHHLWELTLDQALHLAPIENPQNILDVGTGTGAWAVEMADKYPGAHVIGMDLSPIQPLFVPSNCHFEIGDATMEWTYPTDNFDFVHVRELFGSIRDWDYFLRQAYNVTKPGGWVEILEHSTCPVSDDGSCGPDTFLTTWGNTVKYLGELTGNSFETWAESKELLERAGFVDIVEKRYKWPLNDWSSDPKLLQLGLWNQLRFYNGVEDFVLRLLTTAAGWSYERSREFIENMRTALLDTSIHAYLHVSVVYGHELTQLRKLPNNNFGGIPELKYRYTTTEYYTSTEHAELVGAKTALVVRISRE